MKIAENLQALNEAIEGQNEEQATELVESLRQELSRMRPQEKSEYLYLKASYHRQRQEWSEAEVALHKLYASGFKKDEVFNQTRALHCLANMCCEQGEYDKGLDYYRQALRIWNSHEERYFEGLVKNYLGQGRCCLCQGSSEDAMIYFHLAKNYALTADNEQLDALSSLALCDIYLVVNRRKDAIKSCRHALNIYQKLGLAVQEELCRDKLKTLQSIE